MDDKNIVTKNWEVSENGEITTLKIINNKLLVASMNSDESNIYQFSLNGNLKGILPLDENSPFWEWECPKMEEPKKDKNKNEKEIPETDFSLADYSLEKIAPFYSNIKKYGIQIQRIKPFFIKEKTEYCPREFSPYTSKVKDLIFQKKWEEEKYNFIHIW